MMSFAVINVAKSNTLFFPLILPIPKSSSKFQSLQMSAILIGKSIILLEASIARIRVPLQNVK